MGLALLGSSKDYWILLSATLALFWAVPMYGHYSPDHYRIRCPANPEYFVFWSDQDIPIKYWISPDFNGQQKEAIRQAFAAWGNVPGSRLGFLEVSSESESKVRVIKESVDDSAITIPLPQPGCSLEDGRWSGNLIVKFNDKLCWYQDVISRFLCGPFKASYHTYSIALHEIGHVIGLKHPHDDDDFPGRDRESVVQPIEEGEEIANLFPNDIKAVQEIYPDQGTLAPEIPFLNFPIANYTPYTAPISSVFDHAVTRPYRPYTKDGIVIAYTQERGDKDPIDDCYAQQGSQPFTVNGNYVGTRKTGGETRLCYDGHPGIDYAVPKGTPIRAAASGTAYLYPSKDGACRGAVSDFSEFGAICIDHNNGYTTWYLHLSKRAIKHGEQVSAGAIIGESGDVGARGAFHLHFEVRKDGIPVDPYGWQSSEPDPYTKATNVNLWLNRGSVKILRPTQGNPAHAGPISAPNSILVDIRVPSSMNEEDIEIRVGSKPARIEHIVARLSEAVTIEILPLSQSRSGLYDLTIIYQDEQVAREPKAVRYAQSPGVDVVLLLDRTGSMGESGLIGPAKEVAKQFVWLTSPGDMLGVVSFSIIFPSKANVEYRLSIVDSNSDKTEITEAIERITAGGNTSVGAGLMEAFEQLRMHGRSNAQQAVILLSDALENTPPWVFRHDGEPGVLDQYSNPPPVYTIALGPKTDQDLLRLIAETTGGQYYYAPNPLELQTIYQQIRGSIKQQSLISSTLDRVLPGQRKEHTTWVSSDFLRAIFSVFWSGSRLGVSLKAPNGSVITPEMATEGSRYRYYQGATFATFEVYLPQPGAWSLIVEGAEVPRDGEEFAVTVGGDSGIRLNLYFDRSDYQTGQPVKVLATMTSASRPVSLALLTLKVRAPLQGQALGTQALGETPVPVRPLREQTTELQLFDDGRHGDGEDGDGVYANTFEETTNPGSYIFELKAVGLSGLNFFARMTQRALFVAPQQGPPGPPSMGLSALKLSQVKALPHPASSLEEILFQAQGQGIDAMNVSIFDLSGRRVYESGFISGTRLRWNLVDQTGARVANGVYLYSVEVRNAQGSAARSPIKKVVVLR